MVLLFRRFMQMLNIFFSAGNAAQRIHWRHRRFYQHKIGKLTLTVCNILLNIPSILWCSKLCPQAALLFTLFITGKYSEPANTVWAASYSCYVGSCSIYCCSRCIWNELWNHSFWLSIWIQFGFGNYWYCLYSIVFCSPILF